MLLLRLREEGERRGRAHSRVSPRRTNQKRNVFTIGKVKIQEGPKANIYAKRERGGVVTTR